MIWGTKRVEKRLGRVADYCVMCRGPRAFAVKKVSMVTHVYFVGLGRGETLGHLASCETCGSEVSIDPTGYAGIARSRTGDHFRDLVDETFPDIEQVYADRLELERRLVDSPALVDAGVRQELIREVLSSASSAIETRYGGGATPMDWRCWVAVLVALLGLLAGLVVGLDGGSTFPPTPGIAWIAPLGGVLFLGGSCVALYYGLTANRRWMRNRMVPTLATAFRNIRPSEDELGLLLSKFRAADLRIGKKLDPRAVHEATLRVGPSAAI